MNVSSRAEGRNFGARLRALGEVASGMAHDLSNTLGALSLRLELLANDRRCREVQGDNIEAIVRICADAIARVRRLQDFGRRRHERPLERVDPAAILREAIDLARSELEHTRLDRVPLEIRAEIPALPIIRGDAGDLQHALINLLLNARDAMPRGGKIEVTARADSRHIYVCVSDEGTGIPETHLTRIFEPYFTTKGSRGSGLGLAIVSAVMVRHKGSVRASNRPEGGALLELQLSILHARRQAAPRTQPNAEPLPSYGVLVIDDDIEHLEATRRVLAEAGQRVTAETNGRAAIARIRRGERFDLVFCDIGMPDVNGWEVAGAIRAVSPSTRIFMLSGWANDIAQDDPRRAFVTGLLAKPISIEALRRTLMRGQAGPSC